MKTTAFFRLALTVFILSCNDSDSDQKKSISYSADIQPIFTKNCTDAGCHAASQSKPNTIGLSKTAHSDTILVLTDYHYLTEGSGGEGNAIIPFEPSLSHLFQHINTDPNKSPMAEPTMPKGKSPLSASDQQIIYDWIADGARNDNGKAMYSDHLQGQFIITNQAEDFVSLLNIESGFISRIFPLFKPTWPTPSALEAPHFIRVSPDKKSAYVSLIVSGKLMKIDLASGAVVNSLLLGGSPAHIELSTDGKTAVISDFSSNNRILIVDLVSFTLKKTISDIKNNPHAIELMDDNLTLYAAGNVSDLLYKINIVSGDKETFRLSGNTPVIGETTPKLEPYHIQYSSAKNRLYISCRKSNEIRVWNPETLTTTDSIKTGTTPLLFDINPAQTELWVPNRSSNSISVINLTTQTVTSTISNLPSEPHGLKFNAAGTIVGLTCENLKGSPDQHHPTTRGGSPGIFVLLDASTKTVIKSKEVGSFAAGIDFLP